jgi:glycerate dehydrogenase
MKAFIFDPLWDELVTDEQVKKIKESGIETLVYKKPAPLAECKELFVGTDERILCLNPDYVGWKLSAEDYKNIPNLKAILSTVTSFTYIDTSYANEKNIPVCNIRNYSTQAVAEWAITMMLNVARQTPRIIKDGFPLDFDKDFIKYSGIELHGKTAGIIGLGHIGEAIAERCAGLGMSVVYWNRTSKKMPYIAVSLEKLMAESDVIFPAMSLNAETKTIITDELIESTKNTAIIIGISHGIFNRDLVLDMVKTHRLFGFGFEDKPKMFNSYVGNIWAAPEYGWATEGTFVNAMNHIVNNMVDAANSKYPNRINGV